MKYLRVLVVCANADKTENKNRIDDILQTIQTKNIIDKDARFDLYVMNNEEIKRPAQYYLSGKTKYIKGYFGVKPLPIKFHYTRKPFDIIIFLECMIGVPYTTTDSVFFRFKTFDELFDNLSDNGIFITNHTEKYYDGRGVDIIPIVKMYFDDIGKFNRLRVWKLSKHVVDPRND